MGLAQPCFLKWPTTALPRAPLPPYTITCLPVILVVFQRREKEGRSVEGGRRKKEKVENVLEELNKKGSTILRMKPAPEILDLDLINASGG